MTRVAVTTHIAVNDGAADIGLITPRDHVWMDVLAGATIAMLVIGWIYMAVKFTVRRPQQHAPFAYNTINATVAYDFGRFNLKLAGFNLADHRSITSITGPTAADYYTFQAGREILLTLTAKLR